MSTSPHPKVTFGIIVLNGEPFTRYCLRALYPFAHEIIVAEGASPLAAHVATPDGHSTDGTLDALRRFKLEEDPESKLRIVTAEDCGHPNGFWPGEKDEQSRAYAERATGNWLWQVDVDEFYHPEDMRRVIQILTERPEITAASFWPHVFWGGFDYCVDGVERWNPSRKWYRRLFRWGPGYRYATHRPPTVVDADGKNLTESGHETFEPEQPGGFRFNHYSLVLPKQVNWKAQYYRNQGWQSHVNMVEWADHAWTRLSRPLRVLHYGQGFSWLTRYSGKHPPEIERLRADIASGMIQVELRSTEDIEQLLSSLWYPAARALAFGWERLRWHTVRPARAVARNLLRKER